MSINFLEKLKTKCGGETSPRLFSSYSKLSISLDQQSEVSCSLFYCMFKLRTTKTY